MPKPDPDPQKRRDLSTRKIDPRLQATSPENLSKRTQASVPSSSGPQTAKGKPSPVAKESSSAGKSNLLHDDLTVDAEQDQIVSKRVVWVISGAVLLLVLISISVFWFNQPTPGPVNVGAKPVGTNNTASTPSKGESLLRKPNRPVTVRIETPESGFITIVDDEPVRSVDGSLVTTPCEVVMDRGRHTIRVLKKGWNDIPRVIDVDSSMELNQEPTYEPFAEASTAAQAPYLHARLNEPIPLKPLALSGPVQDPFVSANGKEIWYAGSGPDGIGIYYSTRNSAYDEWESPSLLILSRGADLPASPSATEDSLLVAFTVPGKLGRVWGLSRKSVEVAFDLKKPLHYADRGEPQWPSAQISPDGKRLYWLEENGDKYSTWTSSRYELEVEFGKGKKFAIPGKHPHLSMDEMRQYSFDGKQLARAMRSKPDAQFGDLQVIREIDLPDYQPHPSRRQFWVSEDEQWLYYANAPDTSGNLYVVRLSDGPARGVQVIARSVKPKVVVVAKTEEPEEQPAAPVKVEPEKPVQNPDAPPRDYAAFQLRFAQLLAKRDHAGATRWIELAKQVPELKEDLPLVDWDTRDLADIMEFWRAVEQSIGNLKPGESVRIGGSGFSFTRFENEIFTLSTKTKSVERKLRELTSGDLLSFADKVIDKSDAAGQLRVGKFLFYEGKGQVQATKVRLDRGGDKGDEFLEQHAIRKLKVIERDLANQNLGLALQRIDELAAAFPQSESTRTAEKHRKQIYSFVKWEPQGNRAWQQGEDGLYEADTKKEPGSFLVSSVEYENFDLSLEWRVHPVATSQGGIYFRYPGSGKPLETAFKIQLANDAGVAPDKFCTGSLFNVYPPSANPAKPAGQWNTLSMQVRGDQVVVTINGQKVLDTIAVDAAVPKRGFVVLDGEFGGISYQKILLVEGVR